MLCEVEIKPAENQVDREGARILKECQVLGTHSIRTAQTAHSYLLEGDLNQGDLEKLPSRSCQIPLLRRLKFAFSRITLPIQQRQSSC